MKPSWRGINHSNFSELKEWDGNLTFSTIKTQGIRPFPFVEIYEMLCHQFNPQRCFSFYEKLPVSYGHPCLPLTLDHMSFNLINRQDSHSGAGILTFKQLQHHEPLGAVTCIQLWTQLILPSRVMDDMKHRQPLMLTRHLKPHGSFTGHVKPDLW